MLKWTVINRRESDVIPRPLATTSSTTPRKTKRRRSSTSRRRSSIQKQNQLDENKENNFFYPRIASQDNDGNISGNKCQFTSSTPIKSSDPFSPNTVKRLKSKEEDQFWPSEALRDVSNLTPNNDHRVILSKKKCKSEPKRFEKIHQKKKKECVQIHLSDSDCYFKPFEAVDSHIESILADQLCNCNKKEEKQASSNKIDQFDDFLRRISILTSPEDRINLPGLKISQKNADLLQKEVKAMSPLVRKFLDLKFENIHNDSSLINNMSLDQIVEAILDKSSEENNRQNAEENSLSDSGFKSNNSHPTEYNFNNNLSDKNDLPLDKTVIPTNETFNERFVGELNVTSRKRPSSSPIDDDSCTLKRQKCVRRRKTFSCKNFSPFWSSNKKFATIIDDSNETSTFEMENMETNTPLRGCYLENKEILRDETYIVDTPSKGSNGIRRCLLFESPKINESSESNGSTVDVKGCMDLMIFEENDNVVVNVIRCRDLYRPNGDIINAYVKVALADRLSKIRKNKNALLQRTTVQSNSTRPFFNQTFKFPKNIAQGPQKRIHIEVWHRDRHLKSSEFLGCMSFSVDDVLLGKGINGSYRLLSQTTGRSSNAPLTLNLCKVDPSTMGESQTGSIEEIISLDDFENDLKRSTTKSALLEQQKYADENLFLRYLELDPTEGPEAIPAATQRRATGNKSGRTPFTQTKRLTRPGGKSGFGFSVVWTHPPRIERVEKGLPADKAGILPGDYLIFVDKHNVVMMPEIDILNLIRSYGSQLTLEIFRRNPSRNGSVPSVRKVTSTLATSSSIKNDSTTNLPGASNNNSIVNIQGASNPINIQGASSMTVPRRPSSTVCSTNTVSADYSRKKLHLPQVTFTAEKTTNTPDENRKKAIYQLIHKEQQYATAMQFAVTRFVSALAERKDLITQSEHRILFQNCEEILRITEEILENIVNEDGEPQIHLLVRIYRVKCHELTSTYKKYCCGIKKADCVLANKMKNQNSEFVRFIQIPAIPRRRPDITSFIHKPLEHYREVLKLMLVVQSHTKSNHEDYTILNQLTHELQLTYKVITSEAGLMEPLGEGRPLLSVQDLENRLVFTKCKPFVLNKPGRQWIFGGDLSRVEGRNVRQYWTLLFSDLLLFAKVSRDRVLFIIEDPLPLSHITDMFFNVRKKDNEFRIMINPDAKNAATSPTVHCGPDLSRTPKKNSGKKTVILRAPTTELKAVWQNLLQRQIFHLSTDGSSLSSPNMDSPEVPITSSVVTLQSTETNHMHQNTNSINDSNQKLNKDKNENRTKEIQKQVDALIEHKCKQLSKNSFSSKCNAIHLEQWMKGQLDTEPCGTPEMEALTEEWTHEMLRKRSEELQLIDSQGNVTNPIESKRNESRCEDVALSDHSPSRSTTTESQVTVRSSPIVPETVPVCRQCHKNCLTNGGNNSKVIENVESVHNNDHCNKEEEDWQPLLLLGLCANPIASLMKLDPFSVPVPNIHVDPATPENSMKRSQESNCLNCQNELAKLELKEDPQKNTDISPDDSPQTEEHPYHSLTSSALTLRRFGTMSSLERCGSEEKDEQHDGNHSSSNEDEEEIEEEEEEAPMGIDNQAFAYTSGSSIMHWTVKAGSFVAEKMSFFEKIGEDYRSGTSFFDRYLKTTEINHINGEEVQEDETSGATSGEEIWGTPTSGGDMEDSIYSPNYEGKLSPNDGSISSDYNDDTEMMMDELLMTPPITGAVIRGLLPRRTLEPLIEEDCSETSTSSESSSVSETASKSESSTGQGNGTTGNVADECSRSAAETNESVRGLPNGVASTNIAPHVNGHSATTMTALPPKQGEAEGSLATKIHRSESYRHIIESADGGSEDPEADTFFFNRFKPTAKFVNIEQVPKSKSIKIFEFFNVRRVERRVYETFPENKHLDKVFSKKNSMEEPNDSYKLMSPKKLKDKQMDRRFWKQLSKRRSLKSD